MKPSNLNLSKSTLVRSLQCQKSLYLYKNFYHLRDKISPEQQARFDRGHSMGVQAQDLFPGGKDLSPEKPWLYKQSVQATELLVRQAFPVLYEAAFRFEQVLVYLDILVREGSGWKAHEVKSSKYISETYIQDAAIQYYVITNSGTPLEDFYLVHVREDYDPELHVTAEEIFVFRSVLSEIGPMQPFIAETIQAARTTLQQREIPCIDMGEHCDKPYPCDFKGFCSGGAEAP